MVVRHVSGTTGVGLRALMGVGALMVSACATESREVKPADSAAGNAAPMSVPGPSVTPVQSPDSFRVEVETSKGSFTIAVKRALSPRGADRFYELVTIGYFNDVRFFRMVPGFVAQFGIHGDPAVYTAWRDAMIPDEPMRMGNTRGSVAFATNGPDSRSVQMFISLADNRQKLDRQRVFAPIGSVVHGMDVVDALNMEYGEEPNYSRLANQGNRYVERWFPALDFIKSTTIVSFDERR